MTGFYVVAANGCLKAHSGGPGADFTDPLPVLHGGTGLTDIDRAEMLYGLSAGNIQRIFVDTDLGEAPFKTMFNGGSVLDHGNVILADNGPRWGRGLPGGSFIDRPGAWLNESGKPVWSIVLPGSVTSDVSISIGTIVGAGTAQSTVNDTRSTWRRADTQVTTNIRAGHSYSPAGNAASHRLRLQIRIRIGAITGLRFSFLINGGSATSDIGNSDDFSAAGGIVGIRYSTAAGDTGFRGFTANNVANSQIVGATIAPIAANTEYVLEIVVDGYRTTFIVSDASLVIQGSTSLATPGAILAIVGANAQAQAIVSSVDGASKQLDTSAVYGVFRFRGSAGA